jgi:hypothetical protein
MSISAVSGARPQPVPAPTKDTSVVAAAAEMASNLSAVLTAAAGRLDVRV